MSCGVGLKCGSDLVLLWLWCRPAGTAPIRRLAWESPYGVGALKKKKDKISHHLHSIPHLGRQRVN